MIPPIAPASLLRAHHDTTTIQNDNNMATATVALTDGEPEASVATSEASSAGGKDNNTNYMYHCLSTVLTLATLMSFITPFPWLSCLLGTLLCFSNLWILDVVRSKNWSLLSGDHATGTTSDDDLSAADETHPSTDFVAMPASSASSSSSASSYSSVPQPAEKDGIFLAHSTRRYPAESITRLFRAFLWMAGGPSRSATVRGRYGVGDMMLSGFTLTWLFLKTSLETSPNFYDTGNAFYVTRYPWKNPWGWIFAVSYGMYLGALFLSVVQSRALQAFLGGSSRRTRMASTVGVLGLGMAASLWLVYRGCKANNHWKQTRSELFSPIAGIDGSSSIQTSSNSSTSSSSLLSSPAYWYVGSAWTVGSPTIVKEDEDNEKQYCASRDDEDIVVWIDVAWGGNWACPSANNNMQCQTTIQARVSCSWYDTVFDLLFDDEATAQNYVSLRYGRKDENGAVVDDDASIVYDESISYSLDQAPPSYDILFQPIEMIVGTCDGSCIAQSASMIKYAQEEVVMGQHLGGLGMGITLMFLAGVITALSNFGIITRQ